MGEPFSFHCSCCGEIHRGIPTFGWPYPIQLLQIPEEERDKRVVLGSDDCVIDGRWFFVRGCVEIPVHGFAEPFIWGGWVSLSAESFEQWSASFSEDKRSHIGPFFGWLSSDFSPYPISCINLKTRVHLRDEGLRPLIELEPTDHPLAVEQRKGIDRERVQAIAEEMLHNGG